MDSNSAVFLECWIVSAGYPQSIEIVLLLYNFFERSIDKMTRNSILEGGGGKREGGGHG